MRRTYLIRATLAVPALVAIACAGNARPDPVPAPLAASEEIETTIFLLGDAGAPAPTGEPVLEALTHAIGEAGAHSLIVYLGDNVYPRGMPDSGAPGRKEAERRLNAQIDLVLAARARGIFVPGNHDWDGHGPDGWNAIRRQETYIAQRGRPQVMLLPSDGCPGPAVVDVASQVRLVILDTQWWLHTGPKPYHPTSPCPADREAEVTDSLQVTLATAGDRRVIILAHHPTVSGGTHGGYFAWTDHIFPLRKLAPWLWIPLPVIGSVYPLSRQLGIVPQDLSSPAYERMLRAFEDAFADHPPFLFASGHDHNLQVLEARIVKYQLVAGSSYYGHSTPVAWRDGTLFARSESGFMQLEVLKNGRVRLAVLTVDATGKGTEVYSMWLQ